ncbi:MAG: ribonuclease HI [Burkholderiales bacterium]
MTESVEIYTDGACKGNPGIGGWGAWLKYSGHVKEIFGGAAHTTNNRMELTAVIEALSVLKRSCKVRLHTDSRYVQQGISEWIHDWKQRGWRTADKKQLKNSDLWKKLDELAARHEIRWIWVQGHAGDAGNEHADALANRGVESAMTK